MAAALDRHAGKPPQTPGVDHPATGCATVVPSDANDLLYITKGLIIGVAGNIAVITRDDQAAGTSQTIAVPAGVLPLRVSRVLSTGTTATGIVALW